MRRAVRQAVGVVPTLLLTWTLVFAALQMMPGDPVSLMLGGTPTSEEVIAAERTRLGLDRPIAVQYARFLGGSLVGDFGESFRTRQPVLGMIGEQLPFSWNWRSAACCSGQSRARRSACWPDCSRMVGSTRSS